MSSVQQHRVRAAVAVQTVFSCSIARRDGDVYIEVIGEIDRTSAGQFRNQLLTMAKEHPALDRDPDGRPRPARLVVRRRARRSVAVHAGARHRAHGGVARGIDPPGLRRRRVGPAPDPASLSAHPGAGWLRPATTRARRERARDRVMSPIAASPVRSPCRRLHRRAGRALQPAARRPRSRGGEGRAPGRIPGPGRRTRAGRGVTGLRDPQRRQARRGPRPRGCRRRRPLPGAARPLRRARDLRRRAGRRVRADRSTPATSLGSTRTSWSPPSPRSASTGPTRAGRRPTPPCPPAPGSRSRPVFPRTRRCSRPGISSTTLRRSRARSGSSCALFQREQTGAGQFVEVSTNEAIAQITDWSLPNAMARIDAGFPAGEVRNGNGPIYPIFACKGGYVRLIILSVRQWHAMREWLGEPEFLQDPALDGFVARREISEHVLNPLFEAHFADLSMEEVSVEAQRRGIVCTPRSRRPTSSRTSTSGRGARSSSSRSPPTSPRRSRRATSRSTAVRAGPTARRRRWGSTPLRCSPPSASGGRRRRARWSPGLRSRGSGSWTSVTVRSGSRSAVASPSTAPK